MWGHPRRKSPDGPLLRGGFSFCLLRAHEFFSRQGGFWSPFFQDFLFGWDFFWTLLEGTLNFGIPTKVKAFFSRRIFRGRMKAVEFFWGRHILGESRYFSRAHKAFLGFPMPFLGVFFIG